MATSTGTASSGRADLPQYLSSVHRLPARGGPPQPRREGIGRRASRRGYALPGCAEGNTVVGNEATVAPPVRGVGHDRAAPRRSVRRLPGAADPASAPAGAYRPNASTARPRDSSAVSAPSTVAPGLAGHGDQLVHRPVPATSARATARSGAASTASTSRAPGADGRRRAGRTGPGRSCRHLVQQAEVLDELGDACDDPRLGPGLAEEREAAGDRRVVEPPGTMSSPRPCSSAHAAVVSAPLRAPASTTTVASARPLMIRLRRGNVPRRGRVSGANSLTTAPPLVDDRARRARVGRPGRGARGPRR